MFQPSILVRGLRKIGHKLIAAEQRQILHKLEAIASSERPVIIGPWLSEVGFELLYWIPFLRWALAEYRIAPSRVTVVSRGGVAGWYGGLASGYIELLALFSTEEYVALNKRRIEAAGHQKQTESGEVDEIILRKVTEANHLGPFDVIHPSFMYQLLLPLWQHRAPSQFVHSYARYAPMSPPPVDPGIQLPENFTVAKFYFSDAFPRTAENFRHIHGILGRCLKRGPVVMLSSGVKVDDHEDMLDGLPDGISLFSPSDPLTNLGLQTQVVSRAQRFVGTYGGFSYLAPLLGVPSFCVYSDPGRLMPMHMDIAFRAFRSFACGSLETACPPGTAGVLPGARFTAVHVDALEDLPS